MWVDGEKKKTGRRRQKEMSFIGNCDVQLSIKAQALKIHVAHFVQDLL